jgi:hypothetical protein
MNKINVIILSIFVLATYLYAKENDEAPNIHYEDIIKENGKLFVAGEIQKGTPVLLLSEKGSSTCLAETASIETYVHPVGPFKITNLKVKEECQGKEYFGGLIGSTGAQYQFITLKEFKDPLLAKKIANDAKKFEHPNCLDIFRISGELTSFWQVPDQRNNIFIAQAKRHAFIHGPLFVYMNNKTFALKGGCTHDIRTFSINGRLYINYTYSGCDNGEVVILIYDLSGEEPVRVYENGYWST